MPLPLAALAAPAAKILGPQLISGGISAALGSVLGGKKPKKIRYAPTYAQPYTFDPYAYAPGEQQLYQSLMDEILTRSRLQEQEQQRGTAEQLNRLGLGASSMTPYARSRISGAAQRSRGAEMGVAERHKFGLHEARAETQRGRQHAWNLGPGVAGQRETIEARRGHQKGVNVLASQMAQPLSKGVMGMIGGGGAQQLPPKLGPGF